MSKGLFIGVFVLTISAFIVFLASCVITLSDGQGALVFIFSLPIIAVLIFFAFFLCQKIKMHERYGLRVDYFPKIFVFFIMLFFVSTFVPGLRILSDTFMSLVERTFTYAVGKTPYAFFKDRASFPTKLSKALKDQDKITFSNLDLTFAWDRICIFAPYTSNKKAKSVLNMNWNIEERSQIHNSDSVNALVFLYEGSVNHVVDLNRSVTDFQEVDMCISRSQANFEVQDTNGSKRLKLIK